MSPLYRFLFILLSSVYFLLGSTAAANAEVIRMGFISSTGPEAAVKQWAPVLDYLARESGLPFEMVLREDYKGLYEGLENGSIDLIQGGTFAHIDSVERGFGQLLVGERRNGRGTYRSVLIVRAADPIEGIKDLRGKRLALTDEMSASGFMVPRVMLKSNGIDDPNAFFSRIVLTEGHDRSIEALIKGAVDLAAVGDIYIDGLSPQMKSRLRVIAASEPIPLGPVTVRRNMADETKRRLREAFLSYESKISPGMKSITNVDGFFQESEDDFNVLRGYSEEYSKLPPLSIFPYKQIPSSLAERVSLLKRHLAIWIIAGFAVLFVMLAAASIIFRRRFVTAIGLTAAVVVTCGAAVLSAIQLLVIFSIMDGSAAQRIQTLDNLNLRASSALAGTSSDKLDDIIKYAKDDGVIEWGRILRDGAIIASDKKEEIGDSIVDRIRAGTFTALSDRSVSVLDPIMVRGRGVAALQAGISDASLVNMVNKTIALNYGMLGFVLCAGALSAAFAQRKLARPVKQLALAVEGMQEGDGTGLESGNADIGDMAASVKNMAESFADKKRLVELKAVENLSSQRAADPFLLEELRQSIARLEETNEAFRKLRMSCAIGQSQAWLRTLRDAAIRAGDRDPVVIFGPTGCGKTAVARVIHALSPRAERQFGEFNCAEIASADPLVAMGKLFGYGVDCGIAGIDRKGQKGILEEFDGGTLFLDEVGSLPHQAQQLLLLPLEGRPFNPAAGKGAPRLANVRFIFASNEWLEGLVHAGKMRMDILRRIQFRGIVRVPSLAERSDDIERLASHFLAQCNAAESRTLSFTPEAIWMLSRYGFHKYNVSELVGTVKQAFDNAKFEGAHKIELRHLGDVIVSLVGDVSETGHGHSDWDAVEIRELAALRKCAFNVTTAEKELGYAPGSKTLTHHLRGFVYRALKQGSWNSPDAVERLAGSSSDQGTRERVLSKVENYISAAAHHLEEGTTDVLFAKLPQRYHSDLESLLNKLQIGD